MCESISDAWNTKDEIKEHQLVFLSLTLHATKAGAVAFVSINLMEMHSWNGEVAQWWSSCLLCVMHDLGSTSSKEWGR